MTYFVDVSEMDTVELFPEDTSDLPSDSRTAQPVRVEFGAISHRGRVRPNNEDHYLVWRGPSSPAPLLTNLPADVLPATEESAYGMVVADGIGGAAFGEVASMLAVRTAWDLGVGQLGANVPQRDAGIADWKAGLDSTFHAIHQKLLERSESDSSLLGMGTTLTAAYSIGRDAFIGHVGDSRAYLIRRGSIRRLTRDHTLRQELIDAGVVRPRSDEVRSVRNVLTNRLGGFEASVRVDTRHIRLSDGDCLLLCSDGLTDLLDDDELEVQLRKSVDPSAACRTLVDLALERGGRDNATVVVARYAIPAPVER
jgi:serine/threonine protein phosphatase PrpC